MSAGAESSLARLLTDALGEQFDEHHRRSVGGGSINSAFKYSAPNRAIFVKVSTEPHAQDMFEAEAAGLRELQAAQAVRVPEVLLTGLSEEGAFIALEWIDLARCTEAAEALLGEQLAQQHRRTRELFGWNRDNTIGSTPQINEACSSWPEFYRERRLRLQLQLAVRNGAPGALVERGMGLCENLDAFFSTYVPMPSLLHGDLWGGNWRCEVGGAPVIFDPAVYYGDREADLAMTRLFGGFGRRFYAAYNSSWPLDPGAKTRVDLYNLYHVLNHYNLFGGAYLSQAARMMDGLLAAVR